MRSRKLGFALAAVLTTMAFGGAGVAHAAFPDFSGCTATNLDTEACVHIRNRAANLNIKGFDVPIGESLDIRGTLVDNGTATPTFVPPAGTNGFFARAVPVPGGLVGIEWLPGNSVLAITELAGSPSAIRINVNTNSITIPVKVRLVNLLFGMNCHIGTNTTPVRFDLITGTTSPPPPNTPISGRRGTGAVVGNAIVFTGGVNVANAFAVPGASSCGLGLGIINSLVNLKLGLPSAAGNNSVVINNDVAIGLP
jgi:hypothetical protein